MAKASKATMGVGMMAAPMAPMVEYALTKDAGPNIGGPATSKEAARITIKLSDETELTIVRTSVDIRKDMCIWRGVVEGTGRAGDDHVVAGRQDGRHGAAPGPHLLDPAHGRGDDAVVEMAEDKMPQEHAPMPERMRNDPNLRDDPLRNQGDASIMRPVTQGMRPRRALQRGKKKRQEAAAGQDDGRQEGRRRQRGQDGQGKQGGREGAPSQNRHRRDRRLHQEGGRGNYADVKRELVDLSIEEANESFRTSGIGHVKLRLVHAYQTDYVEEGAHFDHVWRFADKGDGYMEEILALRDKYKADVAS